MGLTDGDLIVDPPNQHLVEAAETYENLPEFNSVGDVDIETFNNLNDSIGDYVRLFETKHEIMLDYWVADLVGTIGVFGDYFIDFETIRIDLERSVEHGLFFEWYDLTLDLSLREEPTMNYYSYINGLRPQ